MPRDCETIGHPCDEVSNRAQACDPAFSPLPAGGQRVGIVAIAVGKIADDPLRFDPNRPKGIAIVQMPVKMAFQSAFLGLHRL